MSKRLLFIVPKIYPQIFGGIEVFNYYFIQEMAKEFDVSYINAETKGQKIELDNAQRIKIKSTSDSIQLLQIIFKLIKYRSKYDIIITSFSKTAWYYIIIYPIFNFLFSKEYLIIIHGGGLMSWGWKYPYRLYFRRAKNIIGVSDIICSEYMLRTGLDIVQIPPLIPFSSSNNSKKDLRANYLIDLKKKVFLFVGSLKELKRPNVICEALNSLGKRYLQSNNILMIFAGDGPMKNDLIKYCKESKIEDHFLFLGNISRERVSDLYKMADYYIISSDFEGTPISMLEAMFNELPIIASNSRGINSIIDRSRGVLFDNNDITTLTNAIELLLSDNEFGSLISKNSFDYYSKEFSYEKLLNNYKDLI